MRIGFDSKRLFFNSSGLGNYARFHVEVMNRMPELESLWLSEKPARYRSIDSTHAKQRYPGFRLWGMGGLALQHGANLYHGLSNELPLDWPRAKPSIVSVHDTIFLDYPGYYKLWDRRLYASKLTHAMRHASVVVATSEFTRQRLQEYYPFRNDIQVIYQGLAPEFTEAAELAAQRRLDKPYWVYHSTFNARKNHQTLLQAFSLIWKQCDWDLVLIGRPGAEYHSLLNFSRSKPWASRVHFVVDADYKELLSWLKGAAGFVYPSIVEGFGIPLIEAQYMNLPIAASRIPVFQELMGEGALYFHPNSAEEMAASLLELSRSEQRQRLLECAQKAAPKWNIDSIMPQWSELYRGFAIKNP